MRFFFFRGFSAAALAEISARNMRLVGEKIEVVNFDEDIYKVTETYGYAPSKAFHTYDEENLTFTGYTTNNPGGNTYSYTADFCELVSSSAIIHGANVGDSFYFTVSAQIKRQGTSSWWIEAMTSGVFEVSNASGLASVPAFTTNYEVNDNGYWHFKSANFHDVAHPSAWWSKPVLHLYKRKVQPVVQMTNVDIVVEYFESKPAILPRSKLVNASGVEVNDASLGSPINLWNGVWVVEDSQIERDGNLWTRSTKTSEPLYLVPDAPIDPPEITKYGVYINGSEFCFLSADTYPDGEYMPYISALLVRYGVSTDSSLPYQIKNGQNQVVASGTLVYDAVSQTWYDTLLAQRITATGISAMYSTYGKTDFLTNYTHYLTEFLSNYADPEQQYAYSMTQGGLEVKSGTACYSNGIWQDVPPDENEQ